MEKIRVCQSCRQKKDRYDLIKITKLKDGSLKINPSPKELGRSAYVCQDLNCIQVLIKKKKLKSALKYSNFENIEKIEKELLKMIQK